MSDRLSAERLQELSGAFPPCEIPACPATHADWSNIGSMAHELLALREQVSLLEQEKTDAYPSVRRMAVVLQERVKALVVALGFYADPENWREDDWGVKAVIQGADEYGDPGKIARAALAPRKDTE